MSEPTAPAPSTQTVSVIVPVYNAERYLDQALRSLEGQTHRELQIICVNDGSTDGSPAILRGHAAADPRIEVVDQANAGYGAAMNAGLARARGSWVAILEPDDWLDAGAFADMLACAQRHQAAGPVDIVKTPYWVVRDPDTPRQQMLPCSYARRVRPRRQPFAIAEAPELIAHHPSIWSAIYRTAFLREAGIRFEEIPGAGWADNPFMIETLCRARAICYLPRAYYRYREETSEKAAALSRRSPLLPLERWHDMADVLDRLGEREPVIWREMVYRGFTYLGISLGGRTWDEAPAEVRREASRMFHRMDPALVWGDARVTVADKELFARVRGIEAPRLSPWPYRWRLVREALYSAASRGPRATLRMVARYLGR